MFFIMQILLTAAVLLRHNCSIFSTHTRHLNGMDCVTIQCSLSYDCSSKGEFAQGHLTRMHHKLTTWQLSFKLGTASRVPQLYVIRQHIPAILETKFLQFLSCHEWQLGYCSSLRRAQFIYSSTLDIIWWPI